MSTCCKSCGFLVCNKGKANPNEGSEINWYSQENIDRLWNEMRGSGIFLICHSTDSNAKEYGGHEGIQKGKEKVCMASTLLVYMHIAIYEHIVTISQKRDWQRYQNAVGKNVAFKDRMCMMEAVFTFGIGRTGLLGGAVIDKNINIDSEALTFPTGFEKTVALFNEIKGTKFKCASSKKPNRIVAVQVSDTTEAK